MDVPQNSDQPLFPSIAPGDTDGRLNWLEHHARTHRHLGTPDASAKIAQVDVLATLATVLYVGRVVSNAAGTPYPSSFSFSHTATGTYVITHNLGHTHYSVPHPALYNAQGTAQLQSVGSTSFVVKTKNLSGTDTDYDFDFQVIVDPNYLA